MQRLQKLIAERSHLSPQLQASLQRWAATYSQFGGQDAFPHAVRVLDRAIDHNIVEPHKIGDRDIDPKQLNIKLANIILAHVFRQVKTNKRDFPTEDFERSQITVAGFETFNALRDNDLGAMSGPEYGRILRVPSLGTLARCVDIAQYGPDAVVSEVELSHLDSDRFYRFREDTGRSEYDHIARVARLVYAPLCDLFGYRKLAGDLMEMSYYHLNRGLYDEVTLYLQLLEDKIAATQRLMRKVIQLLEQRLDSAGYTYSILVRSSKHQGKVMEKIDRYSRLDGASLEMHILSLNDLVAFTVILHSKKDGNGTRDITQNDTEDFRFVADSIAEIVSSFEILRTNGNFEHLYTDMILHPKANGYQSFHVDMGFENPDLTGLEAIIRTKTMHEYAEKGGAAHHLYKGGAGITQSVERAYRNVIDAISVGRNPADLDVPMSYSRVKFVVPGRESYFRVVPGNAPIGEALICGGIDLGANLSLSPSRSVFDPVAGTVEIHLVPSNSPILDNGQVIKQLQTMAVYPSTASKLHEMLRKLRPS